MSVGQGARASGGHRSPAEARRLQAAVEEAGRALLAGADRWVDDDDVRPRPPSVFGVLAAAAGTSVATRRELLVALTRAAEEEALRHPGRAHVFATFPDAGHATEARPRWARLAGTVRSAYVFADFGATRTLPGHGLVEVAVRPVAGERREWSVVVDAPDGAVALCAVERPGQEWLEPAERLHDSTWTTHPAVVRRAARACALTARAAGDRTAARVQHELALPVPSPAGSVSVGERLLDRVGQLLEQPPAYTA